MEHFYLYLTVSIVFLVALRLPRRLKAALHWETLKRTSKKAWHHGKLQHPELNNEAQKNKVVFSHS